MDQAERQPTDSTDSAVDSESATKSIEPSASQTSNGAANDLAVGPATLSALGAAAAILAWVVIQTYYPPYQPSEAVQTKMNDPRIPMTADDKVEIRYVGFKNAGFAAGVFGLLAATLMSGNGLARRSLLMILLGLCAGIVMGPGFGTLGGLTGHRLIEWARKTDGVDIPMAAVIAAHASTFGITGFGIGLAIGIPTRRFRPIARCSLAAALAGLCSGLLYVVLAAVALPLANTQRNVPDGSMNRLLWLLLPAMLIGLVLGGLRPHSKAARSGLASDER